MLLKDGDNKKLPIYSNANITKNIDASQLVSGIRVVNVITGKKGRRGNSGISGFLVTYLGLLESQ